MTSTERKEPGEDTSRPSIAAKMRAIAREIDLTVRKMLADYVNRDGWLEAGKPHTEDSFALARLTVGHDNLMAVQWRFRSREDRYPRYPEVSLERRGEAGVVLKLWAPAGAGHPNRIELGSAMHEATGLRVEMYGDFMLGKDPERVEAWRAYRSCDATFQ